jgi:hypothetical protein
MTYTFLMGSPARGRGPEQDEKEMQEPQAAVGISPLRNRRR